MPGKEKKCQPSFEQVGGSNGAGWAKPVPELTWTLGGEPFPGVLGDLVVIEDPDVLQNPGVQVTQTAELYITDSMDGKDVKCAYTIFNTSTTHEPLNIDSRIMNISIGKSVRFLFFYMSSIQGCLLPPYDSSDPDWGCDSSISSQGKVKNTGICRYRCSQGGISANATCQDNLWLPDISMLKSCEYPEKGGN